MPADAAGTQRVADSEAGDRDRCADAGADATAAERRSWYITLLYLDDISARQTSRINSVKDCRTAAESPAAVPLGMFSTDRTPHYDMHEVREGVIEIPIGYVKAYAVIVDDGVG